MDQPHLCPSKVILRDYITLQRRMNPEGLNKGVGIVYINERIRKINKKVINLGSSL